MGRNYLTGRDGDRINAVLAAAGYNFSLLLRWFEELLRVLSLIPCHALLAGPLHLTRCRKTFFTTDQGVSRVFGTFLAERRPALAQAAMATLICWSFSSSMFRGPCSTTRRRRSSPP
jgi:hypothetical protein